MKNDQNSSHIVKSRLKDEMDTFDGVQTLSKFKQLANRITQITEKYNITLKGYHHESLPYFSRKTPEQKSKILEALEKFYGSMVYTEKEGDSLANQQKILWGFLSAFKCHPNSEMFSRFQPDDVIEIYDLEGFQMWRNLKFMEICSYTIEEMYCLDWSDRYDRDPQILGECTEKLTSLLTEKSPEIYDINIKNYILTEKCSEQCFEIQTQHDWMGRIRDQNGQLKMWIVVSKAKVLSSQNGLRRDSFSKESTKNTLSLVHSI